MNARIPRNVRLSQHLLRGLALLLMSVPAGGNHLVLKPGRLSCYLLLYSSQDVLDFSFDPDLSYLLDLQDPVPITSHPFADIQRGEAVTASPPFSNFPATPAEIEIADGLDFPLDSSPAQTPEVPTWIYGCLTVVGVILGALTSALWVNYRQLRRLKRHPWRQPTAVTWSSTRQLETTAVSLLAPFITRESAEAILGDLQERALKIRRERGGPAAMGFLVRQYTLTFAHLLWDGAIRISGLG